jgi:hypothetical protein
MTPNKFILLFSVILASALHVSAQKADEESVKAIETIVGRWQLQKVYAGSREITANPNSENRSWIQFDRDGSYQQQAEADDHGSYRLNENHSVVYLESMQNKESSSAVSPNRVTEYNITIKDDVLTMQPKGENGNSTKYVYTRSGQGSVEEN